MFPAKRASTPPVDTLVAAAAAWVAVALAPAAPGSWLIGGAYAVLVLLGPGYALAALAFPSGAPPGSARPEGGLAPVERAAMSLLLAFALLPLVSLVLMRTPYGLRLFPLAVASALVATVAAALAMLRRPLHPRLPDRALPVGAGAPLATLVLGVAILGTTAAVVLPDLSEPRGFTEALLLPSSGNVTDLEDPVAAGQPLRYTLELTSHERGTATYAASWQLHRGAAGSTRDVFQPERELVHEALETSLAPGERRTVALELPPLEPGLHKLTIVVRESAPREETLELHAWVEVRA